MPGRTATFEDFWTKYVLENHEPRGRKLRFLGTNLALTCLAGGLLTPGRSLLLLAPLAYGVPTWLGPLLLEGRLPSAWALKHPLWTLLADLRLWSRTASGTMDAEVDRVLSEQRGRAEPRSLPVEIARATSTTGPRHRRRRPAWAVWE